MEDKHNSAPMERAPVVAVDTEDALVRHMSDALAAKTSRRGFLKFAGSFALATGMMLGGSSIAYASTPCNGCDADHRCNSPAPACRRCSTSGCYGCRQTGAWYCCYNGCEYKCAECCCNGSGCRCFVSTGASCGARYCPRVGELQPEAPQAA